MKTACIAILCFAPAAFALNNRSAVSSHGLDTNSCSVASPCRSFGAAIAVTSPSGEIVALDSAGYGPFTITGPVTISGAPGVHAAITVTGGGTGILINAGGTDRIILRNLVLIGSGANRGIDDEGSEELRVTGTLIRGFLDFGIYSATPGRLVVDESNILDQFASNAVGIYIVSPGGAANLMLSNSLLDGNDFGVEADGNGTAMIKASTITHGTTGVLVLASNLNPASATVESSTLAFNQNGVQVFAINPTDSGTVFLAEDDIAFSSAVGVQINLSGIAYTFNNNRFTGNAADTNAALTSIATK